MYWSFCLDNEEAESRFKDKKKKKVTIYSSSSSEEEESDEGRSNKY